MVDDHSSNSLPLDSRDGLVVACNRFFCTEDGRRIAPILKRMTVC